MAIISSGIYPINPNVTDGTQLANYINELVTAINSNQASATRPPLITKGGVWTKLVNETDVDVMVYDGTTDYKVASIVNGEIISGKDTLESLGIPNHDLVTVDENGKVGIGNTSPTHELHVTGSIRSTVSLRATTSAEVTGQGSAGSRLYANVVSNEGGYLELSGSPDYVGNYHAGIRVNRDTATAYKSALAFYTEDKSANNRTDTSTEKMRIDSAGNVGIGTNNPTRKIQVKIDGVFSTEDEATWLYGSNGGNFFRVFSRSNGDIVLDADNTYGQVGGKQMVLRTYGGDRVKITASGTVLAFQTYSDTVGGTNRDLFIDNSGKLGYVSSVRASKNNIQDMSDVSWLYNLNPVTFKRRKKKQLFDEDNNVIGEGDYLEETYNNNEYGLIAEDVEQINPELCFYDEVDGVNELRGVHYHKLITPMLKAIQELDEKTKVIDKLVAKVEALEAKLKKAK